MNFYTYQGEARKTAIYPDDMAVVYPTLGVVGEAGEIADLVKKAIRDDGGAFTLHDVPAGEVTIAAWHEASETPLDEATQRLTAGASAPEVTFTLAVRPEKARPVTHGGRGTP